MPLLEVNLARIQQNFLNASKNILVYPMIKCNAYGLGIIEIVTALEAVGMKGCFVSSIHEAMMICKHNIDIYVLDDFIHTANTIQNKNIFPVISDEESLYQWEKYKPGKVILQVECGFNKQGFRKIPEHNLNVFCIMGHMPGKNNKLDIHDLQMFEKRCMPYTYKRSIITSAILDNSIVHYDMARIGSYIYGNYNSLNTIVLKAEIICIKYVYEGEYIGYNKHYIVKHNMMVAMLDLGYAHGFPRHMIDGIVEYKGHMLPILGTSYMNYTFIEAHHDMHIGEYVEVINDNISLEIVSAKSNMQFAHLSTSLCNNKLNTVEYVKHNKISYECNNYRECMD